MIINERIQSLYGKDTSATYADLLELEAISEKDNSVYPYIDEFIAMLKSDKYVLRVRGVRLICMQAKWDEANKIDEAIDDILLAIGDEKPTAVRQVLQYLCRLVPHKKSLCGKIREAVLSIDYSRFKDTMGPLIAKDAGMLIRIIDDIM